MSGIPKLNSLPKMPFHQLKDVVNQLKWPQNIVNPTQTRAQMGRSTLAVIDNNLPCANKNLAMLKAKQLVRRSLTTTHRKRPQALPLPTIDKVTKIVPQTNTIKRPMPQPSTGRAVPSKKVKVDGVIAPKLSFSKNKVLTTGDRIKALTLENDKLKNDCERHKIAMAKQGLELREQGLALKNALTAQQSFSALQSRLESALSIESNLKEAALKAESIARSELNDVTLERDALKLSLTNAEKRETTLLHDLEASRASLAEALECKLALEKRCFELNKAMEAADALLSERQARLEADAHKFEVLGERLRQAETLRRLMHNRIQDLKGNIRVFCRVRPALPSDCKKSVNAGVAQCVRVLDEEQGTLEVLKNGQTENGNIDNSNLSSNSDSIAATPCHIGASNLRPQRVTFKFDRTFGPVATQRQVFEEVSDLVQSAIDGYNVCIFAYGATGSGKTYTMEGSGWDADSHLALPDGKTQHGIIPQAFNLIFDAVTRLESLPGDKSAGGVKYELTASYVEIYNERLRDLLAPVTSTANPTTPSYEIKLVNGETVISPPVTAIKVVNADQVRTILTRASGNRAVAETKLNQSSSRSHSVFQLKIKARTTSKVTSGAVETLDHGACSVSSTLSLVDLAGSERIKESGSTSGDRFNEARHINQSLSTLSNVIMALGKGEKHIPYRNSKLTYLLQNSLGAGSSKTLMFVNVSPLDEQVGETLCSLRLAAKVNTCHIGVATKKGPISNKSSNLHTEESGPASSIRPITKAAKK